MQYIYDPLEEYVNVFKDKFQDICKSTFSQLATESAVDVEENRQTCADIEDAEAIIYRLKKRITRWRILCFAVWLIFASGVVLSISCFREGGEGTGIGIGIAVICVLLICLLLGVIHPRLKKLKGECNEMDIRLKSLIDNAYQQMEPLNRLYDWDIFTRMMKQTIPHLEFDPFFTTRRLEELKAIYGWDESFNEDRSVLFSHSGTINGNPFVICRTKKMIWGEKVYTGSLTIHWTESVRDSNGRYRVVHRSQVLTAEISRPYPEYHRKTRLIYGNTAAPDLTFYREQNSRLSTSKIGKWVKRASLRRKSRNLKDYDYAMMSNEDFEIAFDTSNRNNNQQFALLFTPLAQNSIISILNDNEVGYGDDFDFEKSRMINIIIADHMQDENMDMNPRQFRNFSFDKASEDFVRINSDHFRAIYFAFAPLLSVPMYQQIRSEENIYGRDMKIESAYWEHEALANFWGIDRFRHPDCVTDCILKTEKISSQSKDSSDATIKVRAYGYRAEPRLTYVEKFGGDGRFHNVPVHWQEYLPVTGVGSFSIKEEHEQEEESTQTQRIKRIHNRLLQTGHTLYRHNIYSGV